MTPIILPSQTIEQLQQLAAKYETSDFIDGDPSWFMHQVGGAANQETIAFLAAALSYGSRKQFLPKIEQLLLWSENEPYRWIKNRLFANIIKPDNKQCFYRLYNYEHIYLFLNRLSELYAEYGSLGDFVRSLRTDNALLIIKELCDYFSVVNTPIIPKSTDSACKRLCMFMRWMVRDNSPVDLGLWSSFVNKRTLIIPLDTHVLTEATDLGLIGSRNASMKVALQLSHTLLQAFPDDPTKGDFALFGYGVNK